MEVLLRKLLLCYYTHLSLFVRVRITATHIVLFITLKGGGCEGVGEIQPSAVEEESGSREEEGGRGGEGSGRGVGRGPAEWR